MARRRRRDDKKERRLEGKVVIGKNGRGRV